MPAINMKKISDIVARQTKLRVVFYFISMYFKFYYSFSALILLVGSFDP